jgi:hypothetical protein
MQIAPDITPRVGQRGLEAGLLGELGMAVLVIIDEVFHRNVVALLEHADLLEHRSILS